MGRALHFYLIGLNCRYSHSCLSLFYVRNELKQHLPDSRVTISQFTINDTYYDTLLRIAGSGADILCFSVYIWNATYIARLLRDLYKIQPDRRILLGGPQTPAVESLPKNCTVVDGEIEGVGTQFYHDLAQEELEQAYKAKPGQPFRFPYRDHDFDGELKNRQVYYESSRGCPFRCSYCLSSISKGVLHKDVTVVCNELEKILVHHPKIIKFVDRTFNDNPDRALAIWQFMAEQPGETMFHFEIAPDHFTEKMFSFLESVEPDRFQFEIGIQSTNSKTLAAINRQMDVQGAENNIRRLVQFDSIHLHVDLILGLPYETKESFRTSFNRVFSLQPHYIQMGLLKVLSGTALSKSAEELELVFCEQPPYQILANRWMDHVTLSELHAFGECVEAFYNTRYFRTIWLYLHRRNEEPFVFFTSLLEVCARHHWQDLSITQELLTRILFDAVSERPDGKLLHELLRYDWLRCGHRFFPTFLETKSLSALRSELRKILPQNLEGYYTYQNRNAFLKQGVFVEMSGKALQEVGLGETEASRIVYFSPEQTTWVIKHGRTALVKWE